MKTKKLGKIQFQVLKHNLAQNKKKQLFISFLLSQSVFFHPLFVLYIQCSRICFALYTLIICFGKIFFVLSVFKITLMMTNLIFCVILKSADFSIIMLVWSFCFPNSFKVLFSQDISVLSLKFFFPQTLTVHLFVFKEKKLRRKKQIY